MISLSYHAAPLYAYSRKRPLFGYAAAAFVFSEVNKQEEAKKVKKEKGISSMLSNKN
ncbi:hypothetical protein SD77_2173 [Bacillus badius]|uniref:Uncharacterized protein n=1 Tax=Bacillus badius TaxID=1455 RepID=A0ABR5AYF5_BACBA|nr:hypothetical protein SD78_2362 [Bacillus badius]KIL79719.1 hypothetical protein SD77_2173 [Bacillus badius]